MALDKAPITGSVPAPDDTALTQGHLIFTLSGVDTEGGQTVPPAEVDCPLDGTDIPADFEIWRNTAGLRGTYYEVKLRWVGVGSGGATLNKTARLGNIQVGDATSYTLAELLDAEIPAAPGIYITTAYVGSIAEMKAITKARLSDGQICQVAAYIAGGNGGGGTFRWSTGSTTTVNTYAVFAANEGGNGRWIRIHGGTLTLADFGAQSGGADDTTPVFAAIDAMNDDASVIGLDCSGIWNVEGDWPAVEFSNKWMGATTIAIFTRTSDGTCLNATGENNVFENLRFDGGTYNGKTVVDAGSGNVYVLCYTTDGDDAGFAANVNSEYATFALCRATDPGGTGFGVGGAAYPLLALSSVFNSGPEAIQGDDLDGARIIGCLVDRSGGVGGIAGNDARNSVIMGNLVRRANHGIGFGQKGLDGTRNMSVGGNILLGNDGYGLRMRNYYRRANLAGITNANPAVATFARIAITGMTAANPAVFTSVGHGLSSGDKGRINGIVGPTALNGVIYRAEVLTADTFGLLGIEDDNPVDGTALPAYVSGGYVDQAFEADRGRIFIRSAGGMTGINDLELVPGTSSGNSVVLKNLDGSNFDSTLLDPYTSGGYAEGGSWTRRSTFWGNVSQGNTLGAVSIGDSRPLASFTRNVIMANAYDEDTEYYARQTSTMASNRAMLVIAAVAADINNVTGNGTFYNVPFDEVLDPTASYNPSTGRVTIPHSGAYLMATDMHVGGAGTCTDGDLVLRVDDVWNRSVFIGQGKMLPQAGALANANWYGATFGVEYLEKGTQVYVRVKMSGLGSDTADIKAGSWLRIWALG